MFSSHCPTWFAKVEDIYVCKLESCRLKRTVRHVGLSSDGHAKRRAGRLCFSSILSCSSYFADFKL